MTTRLFDLLGIPPGTPAERLAAAVARWPASRVNHVRGFSVTPDVTPLVDYLQQALEFLAIRTGAGPDAVGVEAEVRVTNPPTTRQPLVLHQMPDIGFLLVDTPYDSPARLYATVGDGGLDLLIEGLPVEIEVPSALVGPLRSRSDERDHPGGGPDVPLAGPFQPGVHDTFEVVLREPLDSTIKVHVKVRVTEELHVIIEPAVPISFGPCRFSGLPTYAVHDLNFLPSPVLGDEHEPGEQALEWTRHSLDRLTPGTEFPGMITVRTVDLDSTRPPLSDFAERMSATRPPEATVEFVLQDLALPLFSLVNLPVPAHGTFGLRRPIRGGTDAVEAFGLSGAPVQVTWSDPFAGRLLVDQLLVRTPASLSPLDQFLFLQMAVQLGSETEAPLAPGTTGASTPGAWTVGVSDDWSIQAGRRWNPGVDIFTIADATVTFWGAKLGFSIKRAISSDPQYEWYETIQVLFDLGLRTKPSGSPILGLPIQLRSLSGKPIEIVLRDIGWNLGHLDLSALAFPEGVQLIFADVVRFIVEEMAWITETSGGRYFSFSGGVSIFPGAARPDTSPAEGSGSGSGSAATLEEEGSGFGIRFRRLRFRTGGNPDAPGVLLDGVTLLLRVGPVKLTGFGMISRFTQAGHDYDELGFGLSVDVGFGPARFQIGAGLYYGNVSGPVDNFTYWMFGFGASPIPLGGVSLRNVRALYAANMAPRLPPPDGYAQNMRILRWYRANQSGVVLPPDRKLAAWEPKDNAKAFAAGLGLMLGSGDAVTVDGLVFWHDSPDDSGFLILIEIFLAGSARPLVYGAVDVDTTTGRWGAMLGLEVTVGTIVGSSSAWLDNLGALTGTLYFGNQPGTFAIGQLADPSTWLTLRFGSSGVLDCSVTFAFCLEIVDRDEGPKAGGFMIAAKGGANWGIGQVQAYVTLTLLVGVWRNESTASGFEAHLTAGLRIKVFYVFNFGIHADVEFVYLDLNPSYQRLSCEFRIETPWWMPDVTFRLEKVSGSPVPGEVAMVSSPIVAGDGTRPGTRQQLTLAVSPAIGPTVDPKGVHTINALRAAPSQTLPDATIAALSPVSLDAVIAINFKQPVDNRTVVEATPAGAGQQTAGQLAITCELVSIGIRRRPRFGTPRAWSDLVASEATRLETPADFPPDTELDAWFEATQVGYWWDRDVQTATRLDPKRLLINAATPFSFATSNPEADENTASSEPHWPCCDGGRKDLDWHTVDLSAVPFGVHAPATQRFTESASTLHWLTPVPVVVPGVVAAAAHVAAVDAPSDVAVIAVVSLDGRAHTLELLAWWQQFHTDEGELIVEAFDGLALVASRTVPLASMPPGTIGLIVPGGMTSVVIRFRGGREAEKVGVWIEVQRARYRTVAEVTADRLHDAVCDRRGGTLDGGGRLAWLPNHEYEVAAEVRVVVGHESAGEQDTRITQRVYFTTKGLPGLNAVERVGDDVEPYVESRYGGASPHRLYRREPMAIAFSEQFNVLVPVDRVPSPTAPPERNQLLEWTLVVERVAGAGDERRVSVTSPDWIVANRGTYVPPFWLPVVSRPGSGHMHALARGAPTRDPARLRLDAMASRPSSCGEPAPSLARSQVLVHEPVDPGAGPAVTEPPAWMPDGHYRASVRRKDAPFVERVPFEAIDVTAFDPAAHGQMLAAQWRHSEGRLAPASFIAGVRRFGVFGDPTWDHVQVVAVLDPGAGEAGVALGVAGLPNVTQALIAVVGGGRLRIQQLRGSAVTQLASAALPPLPGGATGPYTLRVVAFDDVLRAEVGDVRVEAARTDIRAGRAALVALDGGAFTSLVVDSIDAYRFDVQTSRYRDFGEHLGTFGGSLPLWTPVAGVATDSVAGLASSTGPAVAAAMVAKSDREARQRLFDQWVARLAVPIGKGVHAVERVTLTRIGEPTTADALLLESPEPLPFSQDVTVTLARWVRSPGGWGDPGDLGGLDDLGGVHLALRGKEMADAVRRARWLVVSPDDGEAATDPLVFDVGALAGASSEVLPVHGHAAVGSPGMLSADLGAIRPDVGHGVLVGPAGDVVLWPFPLPSGHWEDITLRVLSDGDETRAFLVPVDAAGHAAALGSGRYRLHLAIDRARWRTDTPDGTSNYRDVAALFVGW